MRKKTCKTCARRIAALNGYGRKKRSKKRRSKGMFGVGELGKVPTQTLLAVAGGALAAKIAGGLLQKVPVKAIQDKKMYRDIIKAGLGVVLSMQKNEMIANAGLGMTGFALTELIAGYLPESIRTETPDIAGVYGMNNTYQLGSSPVQMGALGMPPQYETVMGIDAWDGVGTEPDMISGGYVDTLAPQGLKVV